MIFLRLTYAFILTALIEFGVLCGLCEKKKKILRLSIVLNVLTNVPTNLLALYVDFNFYYILIAEICIILIETLGYSLCVKDITRSFIYSLLCNTISFLLGILLEMFSLLCTLT